jgi:hypothetical protein
MLLRLVMKHAAAGLLISLLFSLGCQPSKTVVPLIKVNPSAAASKAMSMYDTNKDQKISGSELDNAPSLKADLDMLGADANKGVTAAQISARIQKWNDDRNGIVPVLCYVTHNGAPLADADVKFVPDPFVADYLSQVGEGETDENGAARVSLPREPGSDMPSGVPPGFYRVQITKAGENIPAAYNTATTLGQEIATDASLKHALEGRRMLFDLKY